MYIAIILALLVAAVMYLCVSKVTLRIKVDIGTPEQREVGIIGRATVMVSYLWLAFRYRAQVERTAGLCVRYGKVGRCRVLRAYDDPAYRRSVSKQDKKESMVVKKVKNFKKPDNVKLQKTIKTAKNSIAIKVFRLKIAAGLGDAAHTALFVGGANALTRAFIPLGDIEIKPDFKRLVFELEGECIISVRAGNIISIAAVLAYEMLRGRWNNGASY